MYNYDYIVWTYIALHIVFGMKASFDLSYTVL